MSPRISSIILLATLLALTVACTNNKAKNPLAGIGSKQPDKVLFDKAMDAMHHNRFDVARLTLQTLINTYPDSEFVARAKLAVGDSWYAEGGTAALAQAEQEYSDFKTFFPNMKEAAEAQLKIANIHYQQMEKPDRDYTHAVRAEDEYRNLVLQFPDSKLVPEAKKRLLEVQEVLADREFGIGRFYFLRESYPASIARLQSLIDNYPLYSRADEAAYLLGQNHEGLITRMRNVPTCDAHFLPRGCTTEEAKSKFIEKETKEAAKWYALVLTRYPIMDRSDDSKKRLEALNQPVPRPTKAAVALNRAEDESRKQPTTAQQLLNLVRRGPDVSAAASVGEPSLEDKTPVSASVVVRNLSGLPEGSSNKLGVEVVKNTDSSATSDATPPGGSPFGAAANAGNAPPAPDPNELKPNAPDPNELKPTADAGSDQALPPPPQVNELANGAQSSAIASADDSTPASDKDISSSKRKKKKGLRKLNPF